MCIDWTNDDIVISGDETDATYRSLDIMLVPCGMQETILGGTEDRIPDDCNYDKDALIEYLGSIQMMMYYNQGQFVRDAFGDESISHSSTL